MTEKLARLFAAPITSSLLALTCTAATFTGPGFAPPDHGGITAAACSIVTVSGFVGSGRVTSVTYKGLTHTFMGDLQFRVYPPGATVGTQGPDSFVVSSPPDER